MSAVRPKSFTSPVLLGIGSFIYKKFGSRTLIDILYNLGFSESYTEISVFETLSISHEEPDVSETGFMQFVFDNADFNVRTLDGHGTFHAMGGIQCITPSDSIDPDTRLPRTTERKSTVVSSKLAGVELKNYMKAKNEGLATIKAWDLGSLRYVSQEIHVTCPDFLWLYGKWMCDLPIPGWSSFMEKSNAHRQSSMTTVRYLPFLNAPPTNYDTVFTSLLISAEKAASHNQVYCFTTFDQQLYWIAHDITAAVDSTPEMQILKIVGVRLGGFHLVKNFLGAIVIFDLTEFEDDERDEIEFILKDINCAIVASSEDNLLLKSTIEKFHSTMKDLQAKGPTARLWVQYFNLTTLLVTYIQAERSGDWFLHLDTVRRMLPIFHATGHFNYAKSAHLRTEKFFSGVWTDLLIEQTLMRLMKVKGGLIGRGFTENTITAFTTGMIAMHNVCHQIEQFCGVTFTNSDEHVDARTSRIVRDISDVEKMYSWFTQNDPFCENDELISLSSILKQNRRHLRHQLP
ncbi:hypothetical protein ALC62_00565 [Cyphomyrmex costatus]|uniref:Uncharacterized protein n=1 Tax=Cyphomyrmex costatus TaxID=456900 RepID=A0A151IQR1_9HYME|nr:hypothetical protein ALC62_00565 [Cyphomyrmex costatus]